MKKTIREIEEIIKKVYFGKKCRLIGLDTQRGIFDFEFERDESLIQEGEIV